jgi:hypothetical protein
MVETLWDKITQFVSPEAGQRRRAALDEFGRDIGYYVPPELRGILGMVAESTPTASIDRASQSAVRMVQPGRTAGQRIGDLGGLLSETAGVVAPAMVAPRAGLTAAQAAQEMFMMPVAGADNAARRFMADESGAIGALHVSPYDFDRFSMDAIGTGEGAQVYGHGLYFAESPKVSGVGGEYYRSFAPRVPIQDEMKQLLDEADRLGYSGYRSALSAIQNDPMWRQAYDIPAALADQIESALPASSPRVYEVNINANPEDFLDWDRPLSEQTGKARAALDDFLGWYAGPEGRQEIYDAGIELGDIQNQFDDLSPAQFAAAMRSRGVPGSKYRDAGSRGMLGALGSDVTRNYVIFDENLINIVRKYGIAGAAAMLGVSAMDVEQAMAQGSQPQPQGLLSGVQ